MRRTYGVPLARAGIGGLLVTLILLACPGTSLAGGASESTRVTAAFDGAALHLGAGFDAAGGNDRVRALQRALRSLGWRPGPVDGLFGPRTESAVVRLQEAAGLRTDGIVGPQTRQAIQGEHAVVLRRGAGFAHAGGTRRVRMLQRELRRRGLSPGPVDGRFGPRTEAAVARLQRAVLLPATGVVNPATRRVLAETRLQGGERRAVSTRDPRREPRPQIERLAAPAESPWAEGTVSVTVMVLLVLAALLLGAAAAWGIAGPRVATATPIPPVQASPVPIALTTPEATVQAIGYASVPRADRSNGKCLRKQAEEIDALCERRGWTLLEVVRDVEGDKSRGLERPGLQYALERIEKAEASALVVSHVGRLTRSAGDLGLILERLTRHRGRLVAIDVRLDTGVSNGDAAADALISVGAWERRRLGERTRKGLAVARATRSWTGRPAVSDIPALKRRIVAMRSEGMTLQAIADRLNAEGVPTVRGGKEWRPSSVQAAAGYRRPGRVVEGADDEEAGDVMS
jgi:peptidoglycan hydrolase-like protein with peptidoglycan-binding domain/DNA invertase Pin-like site-specific DNA recombinase